MPVTMTKDGMAAFERAVRDLVKNQVLVGIPAEDAARTPEPGEPSPINNATIGYINEYGAPERNIPARPHLLPGIEKVRGAISNQLRKAGEAALGGSSDGVDRGLNAAGLIAQNSVRAAVTDGGFAPLSERTLKARQARGRTGDKPLIDTGQYRRSIAYVIRKRGGSSVMSSKERARAAGIQAVSEALSSGNFESSSARAGREGLNAVASALGLKG